MKKLIVLLLTMSVIGASGAAFARGSASQTALVQMAIAPSISIGPIQHTNMPLTGVQQQAAIKEVQGKELREPKPGLLEANVGFALSSNSDHLALACGATALHSKHNPQNSIKVDLSSGCNILVENGTAMHNSSHVDYVELDQDGDKRFDKTGFVHFYTNQGGRTGMARLQTTWKMTDLGTDKNEYSGYVKLYAMMSLLES